MCRDEIHHVSVCIFCFDFVCMSMCVCKSAVVCSFACFLVVIFVSLDLRVYM